MQLQCCCSISILTAIFKNVLKRAEWAVVRSQLPRISSGAQKPTQKRTDGGRVHQEKGAPRGVKVAWTSNLVATNQVGPQPCDSQKSPYQLSTSKIEPRHKISKARWDGNKAHMSLQHSPGKDQGLWAFTEPPCPADVCPTNVIPDEIMKIHDSAAYSTLWLSKHFSSVQIFF